MGGVEVWGVSEWGSGAQVEMLCTSRDPVK